MKDHVVLLGFQADEELVPLYQAARALVLPSLVEGFGLPALEAVSCGTPAVATVESPLPELLREAAVVVDPRDGAGLVRAMKRALDDEELTRHARAWGRRFTWETSARAALEVFQRAMSLRIH
jgi:glycosyltransferase involved in cell wall biosynthesis